MRHYLFIMLCAGILLLASGRPAFADGQYAGVQAAQPPAPEPPPPPRAATSEGQPYTSDGVASVSLQYWLTPAQPKMRNGAASAGIEGWNANLDFARKDWQPAPWMTLSLPAGNHHTLRLAYFRTQGQGNTTAPSDLAMFGTAYTAGDYLSTGYTLQNAKVSLDYLSWPFPVNFRSIRIKTLWEVQLTTIRYVLDAPLKPTQDEDGNFLNNVAEGSHTFVYPSFGLGVEKFLSRRWRVEAKATGFALPDRPRVVDADAFVAFCGGSYEFMVGARGFHFRTSPREEQFIRGTLSGAYVGLRWYPGR